MGNELASSSLGAAPGPIGADYTDERPLTKSQKKNMKRREKAALVNEAARKTTKTIAERVTHTQALPELREKPVGY